MVIRIAEDGFHFRGIDEIMLRKWCKYLGCSESDFMAAMFTLLAKGVKIKKK